MVENMIAEDEMINSINPIYCCNRTKGGNLGGLEETIANRKNTTEYYKPITEQKKNKQKRTY